MREQTRGNGLGFANRAEGAGEAAMRLCRGSFPEVSEPSSQGSDNKPSLAQEMS